MRDRLTSILGRARAHLSVMPAPEREADLHPHLPWMLDHVEARQGDWPEDKCGRWLGFVTGRLAERGAEIEIGREETSPVVDFGVLQAHLGLLMRYGKIADAAGMDDVKRLCMSGLRLSRGEGPFAIGLDLGYVQGVLADRGLIDVNTERDVTRPLFHEAYRQAGIPVPERAERVRNDREGRNPAAAFSAACRIG